MTSTKGKILKTALHLFAQSGFDAVSTSQIADALSITKGALYVTVNFSAHCKVKNHFLEFSQAQ